MTLNSWWLLPLGHGKNEAGTTVSLISLGTSDSQVIILDFLLLMFVFGFSRGTGPVVSVSIYS